MIRFFALFLALVFLFLLACLGSFSPQEGAGAFVFPPEMPIRNLCGSWGASCASFLFNALGYGAYILLAPLLIVAIIYACHGSIGWIPLRVFGFALMLCSACAAFALVGEMEESALALGPGGYVGATLKFVASRYFSHTGCYIFFTSVFLGSLILTCDYAIMRIALWCFGVMPIGNTLLEKLTGTAREVVDTTESLNDAVPLESEPEEIPETIFVPENEEQTVEEEPAEEETVPKDDTIEETPPEPEVEEVKLKVEVEVERPKSNNPFASPVKEKFFPEFEKPAEEISYSSEPEENEDDTTCEELESFFENRNENEDEEPEDFPEEDDTPAPGSAGFQPAPRSENDAMQTVPDRTLADETPALQEEETHFCEPAHAEVSEPNCPAFHGTSEPEPVEEILASSYSCDSEAVYSDIAWCSGAVYSDTLCWSEEPQITPLSPGTAGVSPAPVVYENAMQTVSDRTLAGETPAPVVYENAMQTVPDRTLAGETPAIPGTLSEVPRIDYDDYLLPDIELLTPSVPVNYEEFEDTLKKQAIQLEKAFEDFGFTIRVVEIQTGPVIAQFEIKLEKGLRLKNITGLTNDIAIALKVPAVRIVVIPGKNTVGVEIPNETRQIVRLREVLEETTEMAKTLQIPIFLGKDVSGTPMVIDLAKLPHLLIAGQTGTGKSVCLNSIIMSILMARTPAEVRMIMIDPKTVELGPYKTIPHLMLPVVTEMKKAEAILGWAAEKMEQRYEIFAQAGVKQLSEYNALPEKVLFERMQPESEEEWNNLPRTMPYMVIIIDEMNDLIMSSGKDVENHIIRLAQKSRGAGIHLVLATQKPTVKVITGQIKSNLPARIAFQVSSRTDSQVVLDHIGAEKLLGHGDMLFHRPGTAQLLRGQGTYVSNQEIETVVESIGTELQEFADELISLRGEGEEDEDDVMVSGEDGFYFKCVEQIIRDGRGSASLLQRRFSIGYNRATRMIERMEKEGIVGTYNGSQAREVLLTLSEWKKRQAQRQSEVAEEDETAPKKQYPVNPTAVPRNKSSKRELVKAAAKNNR